MLYNRTIQIKRQTQCIMCRNKTKLPDPPLAEESQRESLKPEYIIHHGHRSFSFCVVGFPTLSKSKLAKDSDNDDSFSIMSSRALIISPGYSPATPSTEIHQPHRCFP